LCRHWAVERRESLSQLSEEPDVRPCRDAVQRRRAREDCRRQVALGSRDCACDPEAVAVGRELACAPLRETREEVGARLPPKLEVRAPTNADEFQVREQPPQRPDGGENRSEDETG
jgi:hypothetical protein